MNIWYLQTETEVIEIPLQPETYATMLEIETRRITVEVL